MTNEAALYQEFTEATAAVLAEREFDLGRHTRLAKARAAVKRSDPRYAAAVLAAEAAAR